MKMALRVVLLCTASVFLALPAVAEDEPKKEGGAEAAAKDVKKDEKADRKKGDKKDAQARKERREKKADRAKKVAKGNKNARKGGEARQLAAFKLPPSIELTVEQRDKIEHLKKEYVPKLASANAKVKDAVPVEKRQAMKEAAKTARAEGKKGKDLRESIHANLTAEEKDKLQAAHKQQRELRQEVQAAIRGVLTQEQVAQLPQAKKGEKKEKKNKNKV